MNIEDSTLSRVAIGRRMAEVRIPLYSQDELASFLECSNRTIQNYEAGKTEPGIVTLARWAVVCKTTIDYLVIGQGTSHIDPTTSRTLQIICERALDLRNPAYGVVCKKALKLDRDQLFLIADMIDSVLTYEVKLNLRKQKSL